MNYDPEDLALYLDEGEENLTVLENGLLALQSGAAQDIGDLFRAAHTLKGSSAMMGLASMARVAHALEAVLDRVRSGASARLSDATLARSLDAVDFIRQGFARLREGLQPDGDPEALARDLEAASADEPDAPARRSFVVVFAKDAFAAVRSYQLIQRLREAGLDATTDPPLADVEAERVGDRLTVHVPADEYGQALDIAEALPDVVAVEESASPAATDGDATAGLTGAPAGEAPTGHGPSAHPSESRPEATSTFVRVDLALMDRLMNLTGELVINRGRLNAILERVAATEAGQEIRAVSQAIQHITAQIQDIVLAARMTPLERMFSRFPRVVADTARLVGKSARLVTEGTDTELDRSLIELMVDPVTHLLRNAVDHGLEPTEERRRLGKPEEGTVRLAAYRTESSVVIEIEDDGRGIDPAVVGETAVRKGLVTKEQLAALSPEEVQMLIFEPGFSTRTVASEISGRGVGMDIVRTNVERAGGHVELLSSPGRGTLVRLVLPFTLATARTLLVDVAGHTLAIPLGAVDKVVAAGEARFGTLDSGREMATVGAQTMPLYRAARLYGEDAGNDEALVVLRVRDRHLGLLVRALIREEEVVVKPIDRLLGRTDVFSGAAILGNGDIALILNPEGVLADGLAGARRRTAARSDATGRNGG